MGFSEESYARFKDNDSVGLDKLPDQKQVAVNGTLFTFSKVSSINGAIAVSDTMTISEAIDNGNLFPSVGSIDNILEMIDGKQDVLQAAYVQIADVSPDTDTTYVFNYANGDSQKITFPAGGVITLDFDGFPTGKVAAFNAEFVNAGDCTITYPTGIEFGGGIEPSYTVSGTDEIMIKSDKNGKLRLFVVDRDMK